MNICLSLFFIFQVSSCLDIKPQTECLLHGDLYHKESELCHNPLTQGPCKNGEWIVFDGSSGSGVCSPSFVCMLGEMPVLDPAGGASCGCADGKEKILGACQTLFTQSVCNEGEVLLPNNFNIGEPICPDNFSCKPIQNCPAYEGRKSEYGLRGSNIRKEQIQFMKDMVCSKASRTICCKKEKVLFTPERVFTPENLIEVMSEPKATCVKNPCSPGKYPWVGQDGVAKCLFHEDGVENCNGQLVEERGQLICSQWEIRSLAPIFGQKCNRRRRWVNDRCQRIFS